MKIITNRAVIIRVLPIKGNLNTLRVEILNSQWQITILLQKKNVPLPVGIWGNLSPHLFRQQLHWNLTPAMAGVTMAGNLNALNVHSIVGLNYRHMIGVPLL